METPILPGSHRAYFCTDGKTVRGPLTVDGIVLGFIAGEIPATSSILLEGENQWFHFRELPDSWMSPQVLQQLQNYTEETTNKNAGRSCGQFIAVVMALSAIIYLVGGILYWSARN